MLNGRRIEAGQDVEVDVDDFDANKDNLEPLNQADDTNTSNASKPDEDR